MKLTKGCSRKVLTEGRFDWPPNDQRLRINPPSTHRPGLHTPTALGPAVHLPVPRKSLVAVFIPMEGPMPHTKLPLSAGEKNELYLLYQASQAGDKTPENVAKVELLKSVAAIA